MTTSSTDVLRSTTWTTAIIPISYTHDEYGISVHILSTSSAGSGLNQRVFLGLTDSFTNNDWNTGITRLQDIANNEGLSSLDIVEVFTLVLIMLASVVGNVVVLYILLCHLHINTVTNVFIVILSISDLLAAVTCKYVVGQSLYYSKDDLSCLQN